MGTLGFWLSSISYYDLPCCQLDTRWVKGGGFVLIAKHLQLCQKPCTPIMPIIHFFSFHPHTLALEYQLIVTVATGITWLHPTFLCQSLVLFKYESRTGFSHPLIATTRTVWTLCIRTLTVMLHLHYPQSYTLRARETSSWRTIVTSAGDRFDWLSNPMATG